MFAAVCVCSNLTPYIQRAVNAIPYRYGESILINLVSRLLAHVFSERMFLLVPASVLLYMPP